MLNKAILLAAVLLQIGLFLAAPVKADSFPEPPCFPCAVNFTH